MEDSTTLCYSNLTVCMEMMADGFFNPEVQRETLLTNYMFTGLRAEISKVSSLNPLYVVTPCWSASAEPRLIGP